MPALFFPNPDALRLVLASGVLPVGVTAAPARAGWDQHGRLWIDPSVAPPRPALAALARFGVQALGGGEPTPEQVGSWAELLPLQRAPTPQAGVVLFELPVARLAWLTRTLAREGGRAVAVRLLPGDENLAWVRATAASPVLLDHLADEPGVDALREQAAGVWVRDGWVHPFPDGFTLPPGHVLLLRPPRSVTFHADPPPDPGPPEFALRAALPVPPAPAPDATVDVALTLAACTPEADAHLWVLPHADDLRRLCADADERAVSGYVVAATHGVCLVRRSAAEALPLPFDSAGFAAHPTLSNLFVPVGRRLNCDLRADVLARVLGVRADRLTWVESGPSGAPTPRSVALAAFRPLAEFVRYEHPHACALPVAAVTPDPFAHAALVEVSAAQSEPEYLEHVVLPRPAPAEPEAVEVKPGWLERALGWFVARRGTAEAAAPLDPGSKRRSVAADPRLGADRTAHRQRLEARLVRELRGMTPDARAAAWADLAAEYAATGHAGDAAVCWVNAAWESDAPPADWLDQWYAAECRAARRAPADPPDRWLAEPGRAGAARVVAAFAAQAAFGAGPAAEFAQALPRVRAALDQGADDLPVRAAWLAGLAVARAAGGDALGLARLRDRLVARLRDKGPGLDLDAPSFLRFHGTAAPERFQTARDWLERVRKPVVEWVERLGPVGRLQGVGMDAETHCTAAYAQLMLAWGLGCLGERGRSMDWAARARKELVRAAGAGVDPAAHAVLAGLFGDRIRGVQEVRPRAGGIPADLVAKYDALAPLARYAVDRLRDHSRILEPVPGGVAFRGLDVRPFRGADRLGERLHLLADQTDPAAARLEARQVLAACAADPCSATVPRVALTVLEAAGRLDAETVREALGHAVPAATWLDAWLRAGKWPDADRADRLPKYLARLFVAAATAAARFGLAADATPLAEFLARRAAADAVVRAALMRGAGAVFRAFQKLGFAAEAAAALGHLDPARGVWPADAPLPPSRLGLAVGWFAAGDDDAANRLLDDARRRLLFADRGGDPRDRTELAIAYADALGFAPPRVALGRLEELFQLLDGVVTTGTTNRYYTLKPLELIDTVVRAVVTDDFALGPAVRGWLADDEFLIRRRVRHDLAAALRDEAGG